MLASDRASGRCRRCAAMVSAGEPLDPETITACREAMGLEPADGYGQTETSQVTANLAGEPVPPRFEWASHCRGSRPDRRGRTATAGPCLPAFFSHYLDGER